MSKRVLIVDDHALVRKSICYLFASNGFSVCGEAEDGPQAIEKAEQMQPDLIVLDFSMPKMNGIEAAKALKEIMPHVPLILFTSHASSVVEREALAAGIAAVVSKQENKSDVIIKANALLSRHVLKRIFQIAYTHSLLAARAELLSKRGYKVASALGNEAARKALKVRAETYDLFIVGHAAPLDVRNDMVQWLKENYPRIRILALKPPYDSADFDLSPDELLSAVAAAI